MLRDIAEGVRGSKGWVTLSRSDVEELEKLVNERNTNVEIDQFPDGGCKIGCEELCRVMFDTHEPPPQPEEVEKPTQKVVLRPNEDSKPQRKKIVKKDSEEAPAPQ